MLASILELDLNWAVPPGQISENQKQVRAAIYRSDQVGSGPFVQIEDVSRPELSAGHVLLRVVACGVCRTDLHIVEGDLIPIQKRLIPGHQIVGEVIEGATSTL